MRSFAELDDVLLEPLVLVSEHELARPLRPRASRSPRRCCACWRLRGRPRFFPRATCGSSGTGKLADRAARFSRSLVMSRSDAPRRSRSRVFRSPARGAGVPREVASADRRRRGLRSTQDDVRKHLEFLAERRDEGPPHGLGRGEEGRRGLHHEALRGLRPQAGRATRRAGRRSSAPSRSPARTSSGSCPARRR